MATWHMNEVAGMMYGVLKPVSPQTNLHHSGEWLETINDQGYNADRMKGLFQKLIKDPTQLNPRLTSFILRSPQNKVLADD